MNSERNVKMNCELWIEKFNFKTWNTKWETWRHGDVILFRRIFFLKKSEFSKENAIKFFLFTIKYKFTWNFHIYIDLFWIFVAIFKSYFLPRMNILLPADICREVQFCAKKLTWIHVINGNDENIMFLVI